MTYIWVNETEESLRVKGIENGLERSPEDKHATFSQKSITANANASAQGRWPEARLSVYVNSFFEKTAIGCRLQQPIG